jgi:hypothetical protein
MTGLSKSAIQIALENLRRREQPSSNRNALTSLVATLATIQVSALEFRWEGSRSAGMLNVI